jgi:hypothetical protein
LTGRNIIIKCDYSLDTIEYIILDKLYSSVLQGSSSEKIRTAHFIAASRCSVCCGHKLSRAAGDSSPPLKNFEIEVSQMAFPAF